MQRVLITHDYNDNLRLKIDGFGRLGVSGRISSITTTDSGQDAGCRAVSFVNVHRATVVADPAVRRLPEAVRQPVVVILALALGNPVQCRPRLSARPATPNLTAPVCP